MSDFRIKPTYLTPQQPLVPFYNLLLQLPPAQNWDVPVEPAWHFPPPISARAMERARRNVEKIIAQLFPRNP